MSTGNRPENGFSTDIVRSAFPPGKKYTAGVLDPRKREVEDTEDGEAHEEGVVSVLRDTRSSDILNLYQKGQTNSKQIIPTGRKSMRWTSTATKKKASWIRSCKDLTIYSPNDVF